MSTEKVEDEIPGFGNLNVKSAVEQLKNLDLKSIGAAALPDDLAKVRMVGRF